MGHSVINFCGWATACLAAVILLNLPSSTQAAARRPPEARARGVVIPFYATGQPAAIAVLRIERLFKDQRRMGFFKVKLLPILACEEVHLEILRPDSAASLLEQLEPGLERLSGQHEKPSI